MWLTSSQIHYLFHMLRIHRSRPSNGQVVELPPNCLILKARPVWKLFQDFLLHWSLEGRKFCCFLHLLRNKQLSLTVYWTRKRWEIDPTDLSSFSLVMFVSNSQPLSACSLHFCEYFGSKDSKYSAAFCSLVSSVVSDLCNSEEIALQKRNCKARNKMLLQSNFFMLLRLWTDCVFFT